MTTKKTSFKKSDKLNSEETLPATVAPADIAHPTSDALPAIGGLMGDFGEEDFRLPRINIVQAVGPLSEDYEPGSVVLNKDIVLLPAWYSTGPFAHGRSSTTQPIAYSLPAGGV